MPFRRHFALLFCVFAAFSLHAGTTHYVDLNSTNPVSPFITWATAATNIQDAIDAATNGDTVLVTNGVYQTGARVVAPYADSNRVAITKPITVQSVSGPGSTSIVGFPELSSRAVRCVYMTNQALLIGFTISSGASGSGGGIFCESSNATVVNCVLINSTAGSGGAVYSGTLSNCTISNNVAYPGAGGGASQSVLYNCNLLGNGSYQGSGADSCVLSNCNLIGNSLGGGASFGGGAANSTLYNCIVASNAATYGGGTSNCILYNCALYSNTALTGGGVCFSTLNNCAISVNADQGPGGGADSSTLNNCIIFGNSPGNYNACAMNYCCTAPLPGTGSGNISSDPLLADAFHVYPNSPCRGAGNPLYVTGKDIDGESWSNPPSIGCDEYVAGQVTGPLNVAIVAQLTRVITNFPAAFNASISGHFNAIRWDFGDGTTVSNTLAVVHSWAALGDFPIVLTVYNDTSTNGMAVTNNLQVGDISEFIYFASASSTNPVPPFTNWATAATNIQDAVDATIIPGSLVLVSNGVYNWGGRVAFTTNGIIEDDAAAARLVVNLPLKVRSVNGPAVTVIQGQKKSIGVNPIRCVHLAGGASLDGFTLTNGSSAVPHGPPEERFNGGGVWCDSSNSIISNCVLSGNFAWYSGGAVFGGTLVNCTLLGNQTVEFGGGTGGSALINCTMTGNSSGTAGGGAYSSSLFNCIAYSNSAPSEPDYSGSILNYCCTTTLPTNGVGNITNAPLFVNQNAGNFHLQSNSPCINAGNNAYAPAGPDSDGNPRIAGGTVDIGAYEFQSPASLLSYAWAQQFGLATDGSADYADADGDGMNNWQEWRAGTDPTNAFSKLLVLSPVSTNANIVVTWQSVANVSYFLQRATNLNSQTSFALLATNIAGQSGTTSYTDTNASGPGPFYYRVGVQ